MKKVLFLGAAANQVAPIKYAKDQGHYVITCDYLPDNPGHHFADEYHNISTTDKEAILELSTKTKIDGIVAYASDVSAPTQAFVGNRLSLPSNPYKSVMTLTRKDLFRNFLEKNGFFAPISKSFYIYCEAEKWVRDLNIPVMVKPVDSSGSKGVTKVNHTKNMRAAFIHALSFSKSKKVIIEEFVENKGYKVAGDGFVVDGKLVFRCWANQHNDKYCSPFVPVATSFPSVINRTREVHAHQETQKLLNLLDIKTGAFNFEFYYDKQDNLFFQELGPRNGGNFIPETIKYATNTDLIKYTVDASLGKKCSNLKMKETNGFYSAYMIHSEKNGKFNGLWFSNEIAKNILAKQIHINIGQNVEKMENASDTIGVVFFKFNSMKEMLEKMDNMKNFFKVLVL